VFNGFDREALACYFGASKRYVEDLDSRREGPPRVKIAGKWIYPKAGVDAWIAARTEIQCNAPNPNELV
jgi:hypothetical protein